MSRSQHDYTTVAGPSSSSRVVLRVDLDQVARSNTFSADWPELRTALRIALIQAASVYTDADRELASRSETPRHARSSVSPGSSPVHGIKAEDKSDPLSSPVSGKDSPSSSSSRTEGAGTDPYLTPSTAGGAVFPPFPPLQPSRRRREGSAASEGASNSPGPTSGRPFLPVKINGHAINLGVGKGVFDDEWDEDVTIGGKVLPGRMDAAKAHEEVERLTRILNDMDYPPFTLQRLAELVTSPRSQHKSLGKFLRAVEKTLLVNTPWEAPSYVPQPPIVYANAASSSTAPVPNSSNSGGAEVEGEPQLATAAPWQIIRDGNSTLPISPRTPMFSPIPFLVADRDGNGSDSDGAANSKTAGSGGQIEEGLMSPLILGQGAGSTNNIRSPTPEPDDVDMGASAIASSSDGGADAADSSAPANAQPADPAHQPYLGRVDELDTGPVMANGHTQHDGGGNESSDPISPNRGRDSRASDQVGPAGTGEGGNMPLHGMSDRPVPISATTTIPEGAEAERRIAGMPRGRSGTISEGATSPPPGTSATPALADRFVSAGTAEESEAADGKET